MDWGHVALCVLPPLVLSTLRRPRRAGEGAVRGGMATQGRDSHTPPSGTLRSSRERWPEAQTQRTEHPRQGIDSECYGSSERAGDLPRSHSSNVTSNPPHPPAPSKVHTLFPGSLTFQRGQSDSSGNAPFITRSGVRAGNGKWVRETEGEQPTLGTKGKLLTTVLGLLSLPRGEEGQRKPIDTGWNRQWGPLHQRPVWIQYTLSPCPKSSTSELICCSFL